MEGGWIEGEGGDGDWGEKGGLCESESRSAVFSSLSLGEGAKEEEEEGVFCGGSGRGCPRSTDWVGTGDEGG
jgi:hypothetical protein